MQIDWACRSVRVTLFLLSLSLVISPLKLAAPFPFPTFPATSDAIILYRRKKVPPVLSVRPFHPPLPTFSSSSSSFPSYPRATGFNFVILLLQTPFLSLSPSFPHSRVIPRLFPPRVNWLSGQDLLIAVVKISDPFSSLSIPYSP